MNFIQFIANEGSWSYISFIASDVAQDLRELRAAWLIQNCSVLFCAIKFYKTILRRAISKFEGVMLRKLIVLGSKFKKGAGFHFYNSPIKKRSTVEKSGSAEFGQSGF